MHDAARSSVKTRPRSAVGRACAYAARLGVLIEPEPDLTVVSSYDAHLCVDPELHTEHFHHADYPTGPARYRAILAYLKTLGPCPPDCICHTHPNPVT